MDNLFASPAVQTAFVLPCSSDQTVPTAMPRLLAELLPVTRSPFMELVLVFLSSMKSSFKKYSKRGFVLLRHCNTLFMKHCKIIREIYIIFACSLILLTINNAFPLNSCHHRSPK